MRWLLRKRSTILADRRKRSAAGLCPVSIDAAREEPVFPPSKAASAWAVTPLLPVRQAVLHNLGSWIFVSIIVVVLIVPELGVSVLNVPIAPVGISRVSFAVSDSECD